MDRTPYTYRISWTALGLHYYGVRYGKGCDPSDLWVTYFTSSDRVRQIRYSTGEPDVIEVRKTFKTVGEAISWEKRVLSKLNVLHNTRWVNGNVGGAIAPMLGALNPMYGISRVGEKHKGGENISLALKKFFASEEGKKELAARSIRLSGENNPMYGKTHTEEYKAMMKERSSGENNAMYGRRHTDDARRRMSEAKKGKPAKNKGKYSLYLANGELVTNARAWCAERGLNYSAFTSAAKNGITYKGLVITKVIPTDG